MNKIKKILPCLLAIIMITFSLLGFSVSAENSADPEKASITVVLTSLQEKMDIAGRNIYIYKIADFTDYKQHQYNFDSKYVSISSELDFSDSDKTASLDNAKRIMKFINESNIQPDKTLTSDSDGKAFYGNIEKGIYLISVQGSQQYNVTPFIVEIPFHKNNSSYVFNVIAYPKADVDGDNGSGQREPDEPVVPPNPKIPQTGQMKLPVPILFFGGITLLVLGFADYCRKGKKDEKVQK